MKYGKNKSKEEKGYLKRVGSFRDLVVYRKARVFAREVFEKTKTFPREETYSLTDQIRRSSRSIGAQIAEAWAKRRYVKHFISKLTDADGEQNETQHWIETARDCHYLNEHDAAALLKRCEEIGRLLGGMIAKAEEFCSSSPGIVKEDIAKYFIDGEDEE